MAHPPLTDRPALLRARTRALRSPEPALFLQDEAVAEVQERLELVNRTFTSASVVTGFPALWQTALPQARVVEDAEVLDLAPATQDLVVHALALHWADDPLGQIIQCRRALRPDGLFIGLMFGGRTLHELRSALAEAEAEVSGGLSPRVVPMGDIRDLGALVQRAGLALPVADSFTRIVQYRDLFHLAADLRAMGETNALAARLRRPTRRAVFLRAAEILARSFPAEGGRITATFEIVCLTGWAPHESQQQPLRPGSAAQRLADALNVTERPLPTSSQDG
ncbi:methyltransferase domain-containing protein [Fuscovulum blasticum]|uniref:methyltransferase domain-containing protein n=1 Tax=Fuscovulum blasticum TaxID=1075 RepID=UPI000D3EAC7C|nr:methyltransferase domain-containing protein [Fuscovulum blasticum]AWD22095.1 SAM-dependent methyltransferase [Fuscovulum blasticum]